MSAALIRVLPATADRFDDVAVVLSPRRRDQPACWCLSVRLSDAERRALPPEAHHARLRQFAEEGPAPGVIAYLADEPVGWCSIAPRTTYHRLLHSRTIPMVDDLPVWSLTCFVVRPAFRRQGVMRALLRGAVDYASAAGAPVIEAYPADAGDSRMNSSFAYVGTVALFESEGFVRIADTAARSDHRTRVLMRCATTPARRDGLP